MAHTLSRNQFLKTTAAFCTALGSLGLTNSVKSQTPQPLLSRIKAATIGAPDLDTLARHYGDLLNYSVAEEGVVSRDLAVSWGAPGSTGRPYLVLQPEIGEDVFVRAVEIDQPEGFKAITTWGWNSIEFVVDDIDVVYERVKASSLEVLGAPELLAAFPTIGAMQVRGPAEEVLHLTVETGDRSTSILPPPGDDVGRLIITILTTPDVPAVTDWYAERFAMAKNPVRSSPIGIVNQAQGLPPDYGFDATFLSMSERGNFLELWGLHPDKTTDRPRVDDQLLPGIAIASYAVKDLDGVNVSYLTSPETRVGVVYGGNRSAVFTGPVGELVELIEE